MTARTHDLAAFTALHLAFVALPLPQVSLFTAGVAMGINFIGGLLPDIDNKSSHIWKTFRAGSVLKHLVKPFIGGHRLISHSLLGLFLAGLALRLVLNGLAEVLLVNLDVVWWSFILGYGSHLLMDAMTRDGIPLFFPLPLAFGMPPVKKLRVRTGGMSEKLLVFPVLLVINGLLLYTFPDKYLNYLQALWVR